MDPEFRAELEQMLDARFEAFRTELREELDARFAATDARIERLAEITAGGFASVNARIDDLALRVTAVEQRLDGVEQRLDGVEQRLDAVEQRLDTMEREFGALRTRVIEGFISNDERFRSLELRSEQLEARIAGEIARVRHELDMLNRRIKGGEEGTAVLNARLERFEASLLELNVRLDGLSDDMRQRFRVVNDRLASIAA